MTTASRHRLLLAVFCAVMWLPGLPARTLWPTDEPRYALIARDMAASGDYVVPVKRGDIYHSQPPLFLWSEILAGRILGGMSEAAVRIPSFLAGLATVLVTHALGTALFGPGAGLAAALVLSTDLRFLIQAQWASTDMMLALFMTVAMACFHAGLSTGRRRWYLLMYAAAGCGTMTKGPVGFVLPGLAIVSTLAASGRLREVLRMRLVAGAAIVTGICAPWLLLFWWRAGGAEVSNLVLKQSFQRYAEAWNNIRPWYYFIWRFPVDFLPWSLLLGAALVASIRMEREHRSLLWPWLGAVLVFFSISSGKRGVYVLGAHPAAALLTGWFLDRAVSAAGHPAWRRVARSGVLATAVLFGVLALFLMVPLPPIPAGDADLRTAAMVVGAIALASGIGIAASPLARAGTAIAGGTGAVALAAVLLVSPTENRRQNIVPFAAEIARQVPEGAPLGIVRDRFEDLVFYSGRAPAVQLRSGRRLDRWMNRPETVYAVLDRPAWARLNAAERPTWELLAQATLAGEEYYLVVKR